LEEKSMNEDAMKTLSDEEKRRSKHPYWIYDSIQLIPEMLTGCLTDEVGSQIGRVLDVFKKRKINKIVFLGRGSSYFLTLSLNYLFQELVDIPTCSYLTNILELYHLDSLDAQTAVFFHSTSGKSEGDKRVVELSKEKGAYTVGVTDIASSTLAQSVDDVIIGPGGSKVELPATRTYATALFRMSLFAIKLAKQQGKKDKAEAYEKILARMPEQLKEYMPKWESQGMATISAIESCSAFFVLGYGPNLSTADETALAFGQCGGIPTMPYELENFIHGPVQFLTKEMGVVALVPDGPLQERMLRAVMAAKTVGAKTFVIAAESMEEMPFADVEIRMPNDIPDALSAIMYMVPMWQIAYEFSKLGRGGHADRLSMDKEEFKAGMKYLLKKDKWTA
jgi:glucoselysine-6-phosphate deglycase